MAQERGAWTGTVGFVLASMGSAVGLGNIWRFSYITGEHGGAAFILVYIGCMLAVGLPIMLAEFLIGRRTQRNVVGAFRTLRPHSFWELTGWLGVVAGFVILSYYAVVGGWVLHYLYLSLADNFQGRSAEQISALFTALSSSPLTQVFWHAVFMAMTIAIVARGVSGGLEWGNKIMMPLLFLLLCVLLVYALQTDGARQGLAFLLRPRWHQISAEGVLEALGQAFFSLSVGMGVMITYGSYLSRDTNLVRAGLYIAVSDTAVALLAGFVIFPLVFTFQLEPASGPGLIFRTLPITFSLLPAGQLIAALFFLLLTFAALSSAISLLEVVVAYCIDEKGWSRAWASWGLGGAIFLCGIPSALGEWFLGVMDTLATNYLLPLGGLLIALFTGWALSTKERHGEFMSGEIRQVFYTGWVLLLRFITPVAVALILLRSFVLF
jgi:NSS family neurotransmitter:Na+ symporter